MSQLPDILVIRHGETEWNRERRWQGKLDSPLTEKGRAQAVAVGRKLAALGVVAGSHQVWSSPQPRAMTTAELAIGDAGLKIEPTKALREIEVGDCDRVASGANAKVAAVHCMAAMPSAGNSTRQVVVANGLAIRQWVVMHHHGGWMKVGYRKKVSRLAKESRGL